MSSEVDFADSEQEMLAELAELDLAFARHVHAGALAAEGIPGPTARSSA